MRQLGQSRTLLNVHTGIIVLWCAFAISLLAVDATGAQSVESAVKTVISVTKLNESENATVNDTPRSADKAGDTSRSVTVPSLNTAPAAPTPTLQPAPSTAVVIEPLEQLPSIDVAEPPARKVIMYQPAVSLAASPRVVLDASNAAVTPLQASDQGWKLFNVAWYWWALLIAIGYYLARQFKYAQSRRAVKHMTVS